jgi:hypothetical protein
MKWKMNWLKVDKSIQQIVLPCWYLPHYLHSTATTKGTQVQDLWPIQKELCPGTGCTVFGFTYCFVDPESDCLVRGKTRAQGGWMRC